MRRSIALAALAVAVLALAPPHAGGRVYPLGPAPDLLAAWNRG